MTEHERTTRADVKHAVLRAARGRRRRRAALKAAPVVVILLAAGITWNMAQQPAPPPPGPSLAQHTPEAEELRLPASEAKRQEAGRQAFAESEAAESLAMRSMAAETNALAAPLADTSPSPVSEGFASRAAIRPPAEPGYILNDDELLAILADMGRPSGLIKRGGRTIIVPHDGKPMFPDDTPGEGTIR